MYRWTVKKEDIEKFVRTWEEGTLKIQTHCTGAMGSILLRSSENPEHFFGMARWPSKEIWEAAQLTMPLLDLRPSQNISLMNSLTSLVVSVNWWKSN